MNCFVFILIGLQLKIFVSNMTPHQMLLNVSYGIIFTLALIIVRMFWVFIKSGIHYFYKQRTKKGLKDTTPFREATLIGWSGMRGIVSLTAALALPFALPNGTLLAGREEVIFITFVVILLTILIPGFTLSPLIDWLKLNHSHEHHKEHRARKKLEDIANEKIKEMHALEKISNEQLHYLTTYFQLQRRVLEISSSSLKKFQELEFFRLEIIREQRKSLLEIWKRKEIGDTELRELEHELDMEETRLARAELK